MWRTFDNREIPFNELSHQHLSNIYWFFNLFSPQAFESIKPTILEELNTRFNGQLLKYRPHTHFKYEMELLYEKGYLKDPVINNLTKTEKYDIVVSNEIIGEYIIPL